ncbi:protein-tyrosine phosphatase-like protein [Gorgonomyces haynaldii]|nr:protein-tyrosine phosphatase-like protein [Gorgonomyces haynaldii]
MSDWNYESRREIQEIMPNLFIGPYSASKQAKLAELGITSVLWLVDEQERRILKPQFLHLDVYCLSLSDQADEQLLVWLNQTSPWIHSRLGSGRVLVVDMSGISRSPSIVIGYLMLYHQMTFQQAFQYVVSKRFCVSPNDSFRYQLKGYEPILEAQRLVSDQVQRPKRQFEDE